MAPTGTAREQDAALSLTRAVVVAANSPLILLDGELKVVALSAAFASAFGLDAAGVGNQQVYDLGEGEWDIPELRTLLEAALADRESVDAEMDLLRQGHEPRRLVAHAERLEYVDLDQIRLVLAIADVTAAKAADQRADDLRKRNAMLVQEARHRVANSLQIIASVLMQHARQTQSDELRGHLSSAHHRVMSVAALERHLAGTDEERVKVRPYLEKLCESIADSMIADRERVSLEVVADDSSVDANESVSLGLITTELVINAVKYAFPDGRSGSIRVTYAATESGWALTVSDDGIGFPADPVQAAAGLGTSIVQALAAQLQAVVVLDRAAPGAAVSIVQPDPAANPIHT